MVASLTDSKTGYYKKSKMKLIVGLGNPGLQYEQTRHNVGFRVVDDFAEKQQWKWERQGRAMLASGTLATEKIVLVKPLTYMNNSGEAVGELVRWYKLSPEQVIVIYDELDLPLGKIRLRAKGSAGGHNGLNSIITHLHTNEIPRLRIGIGRPANNRMDTVKYVLGVPAGDERITLATSESKAVDFFPILIQQDINTAMNLINPEPKEKNRETPTPKKKIEQPQTLMSSDD